MKKLLAGGSAALMTTPALAAVDPLDVSSAVTYLETNVGDNVILVGVAMISLAALAVAIKWVKAAIFG